MTAHPARARASSRGVAVALLLGFPYAAGLLLLTLSPQPVQRRLPALLDLVFGFVHGTLGWNWLGFNRLEFLANILVFVPIGILAYIVFRDRLFLLALAAGPALSITVEVTQSLLLPHRVGTIVDVIANSAGATIGVVLAWAVARLVHRPSNAL